MSQQPNRGPVLSVVDYDAWRKGYMPPSEHILIDALAHRGARVVLASDMGDIAYWVVIRGERPKKSLLAVMRELERLIAQDEPPDILDRTVSP